MNGEPHLHLAGIPVRVEPMFFAVIAVIGLAVSPDLAYVGTFVVLAFVSVLLHEFGHALAFRAYGCQPRVVLQGFGGLTMATGRLTPGRNIAVSLAGPFSALVLLGLPSWLALAAGLGDGRPGVEVLLAQAVWINVGWSLLNLVPLLPLDGGSVTASALELVSARNGRRVANVLSIVLAGVLGVWAVSAGFVIGAAVAVFFGVWNVNELRSGRRDKVVGMLSAAERALVSNDGATAEREARRALAARPPGPHAAWARELIGWSRLLANDAAGAREATERGQASAHFQAALAFAEGRRDEAVSVSAWALAREQRAVPRLLGVAAIVGMGAVEEVVEALVEMDDEGGRAGGTALHEALLRFGHDDAARHVAERLPH